jgi:hypothetical protein
VKKPTIFVPSQFVDFTWGRSIVRFVRLGPGSSDRCSAVATGRTGLRKHHYQRPQHPFLQSQPHGPNQSRGIFSLQILGHWQCFQRRLGCPGIQQQSTENESTAQTCRWWYDSIILPSRDPCPVATERKRIFGSSECGTEDVELPV